MRLSNDVLNQFKKVNLKNTPHSEFHKTLHRLPLLGRLWIFKKKVVTSYDVHIGGAKVALPFANYIVCHFGATYMGGMNGDPLYMASVWLVVSVCIL